ncbi:unnamed protein product [Penicillium bialowiezense]
MNQAQDDRRANEIAAYVCGFSLALTAVIARAVCRIRAKITFGLDDWMIFFATHCRFIMEKAGISNLSKV